MDHHVISLAGNWSLVSILTFKLPRHVTLLGVKRKAMNQERNTGKGWKNEVTYLRSHS